MATEVFVWWFLLCVVSAGYVLALGYCARVLQQKHSRHAHLADTSRRWVVSQEWRVWKSEVLWMSLYFSVVVWLSIAFVHLPALQRQKNGAVGVIT